MRVAEVMAAPVATIGPDDSVGDALRLLDQQSQPALPVITPHGGLVGIVSEADVICDGVPRDLAHHAGALPADVEQSTAHLVREVMSHHPVCVRPETDLAVATRLLDRTALKALPVLDAYGAVVGLISRRELRRAMSRPAVAADREIETDLRHRLRRRDDWRVTVEGGMAIIEGPSNAAQRAYARATARTVPGVRQVDVRG